MVVAPSCFGLARIWRMNILITWLCEVEIEKGSFDVVERIGKGTGVMR